MKRILVVCAVAGVVLLTGRLSRPQPPPATTAIDCVIQDLRDVQAELAELERQVAR